MSHLDGQKGAIISGGLFKVWKCGISMDSLTHIILLFFSHLSYMYVHNLGSFFAVTSLVSIRISKSKALQTSSNKFFF